MIIRSSSMTVRELRDALRDLPDDMPALLTWQRDNGWAGESDDIALDVYAGILMIATGEIADSWVPE